MMIIIFFDIAVKSFSLGQEHPATEGSGFHIGMI